MNTGPHPSASLPLPISEASGGLSLSLSLSPAYLAPMGRSSHMPAFFQRWFGNRCVGCIAARGRRLDHSLRRCFAPSGSLGAVGGDAGLAADGWGSDLVRESGLRSSPLDA